MNVLFSAAFFVLSVAAIAQTPTPTPLPTPNDPLYDKQWYLGSFFLNVTKAWEITKGSPTVKVAVIDTGVDPNHPDLKENLIEGYNVIDQSTDTKDGNGHGTFIVGLIAAQTNNRIGIAGVAPNVKIMPVKAMNDDGNATYDALAAGITWAANNGASVIVIASGGDKSTQNILDALKLAQSKGIPVVCPAGHGGTTAVAYPLGHALDNMFGAAAIDSRNVKATFTNINSSKSKAITIGVPGLKLLSTMPTYNYQLGLNRDYAVITGNSLSAALLGGAIALARSINPQATPVQIKQKLCSSTHLGSFTTAQVECGGSLDIGAFITAMKP